MAAQMLHKCFNISWSKMKNACLRAISAWLELEEGNLVRSQGEDGATRKHGGWTVLNAMFGTASSVWRLRHELAWNKLRIKGSTAHSAKAEEALHKQQDLQDEFRSRCPMPQPATRCAQRKPSDRQTPSGLAGAFPVELNSNSFKLWERKL